MQDGQICKSALGRPQVKRCSRVPYVEVAEQHLTPSRKDVPINQQTLISFARWAAAASPTAVFVVLLVFFLRLSPAQARAANTIVVKWERAEQEIDGFGASTGYVEGN